MYNGAWLCMPTNRKKNTRTVLQVKSFIANAIMYRTRETTCTKFNNYLQYKIQKHFPLMPFYFTNYLIIYKFIQLYNYYNIHECFTLTNLNHLPVYGNIK